MNFFTLIVGFALIAAATAHGHAMSYVKRSDQHGHHTEISHGSGHGNAGGGDQGHGKGSGGEAGGHGYTEGHGAGAHESSHAAEDHGAGGHDDHHIDYHHHPSYNYEYGVYDTKTKDHHTQWENRDGDKVHGEYTLDEADGTKRVVKYSSDKHGGFTAHVELIGHAMHPQDYGKHGHDEGHGEHHGHEGGHGHEEGHGHGHH